MARSAATVLDEGLLSFTIESRLLRELGERLVKNPEVAIVELVKNAYDADATECGIAYRPGEHITVSDDGDGMTLARFKAGWMRIGTSAKEGIIESATYGRPITGEKGIGRFAVRFLGRHLRLESVAFDPKRKYRTRLVADFNWRDFDRDEDLGKIQVPYTLTRASRGAPLGTTLQITELRPQVRRLELKRVRTESISVLSPHRSLFRDMPGPVVEVASDDDDLQEDPGFSLLLQVGTAEVEEDVASTILDAYVLRAVVDVDGPKRSLKVYRRDGSKPYLSISYRQPGHIGALRADIRFFPRRKGVFARPGLDGRAAYRWIAENSGVAVFDRGFRVQPYGLLRDDWLSLAADTARNRRDPRSSIARTHFPMSPEVRADTSENWMLRLPQSAQLIGVVQVEGSSTATDDEEGLVAAADREGFVANEGFEELYDLIRGAVEAIAQSDRRLQQEEADAERDRLVGAIREETQAALDEIDASTSLSAADKARLRTAVMQTQELAEQHEESTREHQRQLEVMSLLGVVAGFMTHEFGVALQELREAQKALREMGRTGSRFEKYDASLGDHIQSLTEYMRYSSAYIAGARDTPSKAYKSKPRLQQMVRVFGDYASDRHIEITLNVEPSLLAPLVPVSLYNGLALNLYTNALKAITAKAGRGRREIAFRAWNDEKWHYLQVSDTGVGIPTALRRRVFDPLFTTTANEDGPLGSGMGLGLALVQRGVQAFGGDAEVVDPPPSFVTCVQVKLPLNEGS